MIPFYYQYYPQYIDPNIFTYPNAPFQEKPSVNATQMKQKKEQSLIKCKIQENSVQNNSQIKLGQQQLEGEGYKITKRLWTEQQDKVLVHSVQQQQLNWKQISDLLIGRNPKMCYNRYKRICKKKKILWTKQEDERLKYLVEERNVKWKHLEQHFQNRKAKQLRERYLNFLRSNISRQPWTLQEDIKLIECINQIGKKWKQIQKILTNRSQNQIKNRYYGRIQHILKKKQQTKSSNNEMDQN